MLQEPLLPQHNNTNKRNNKHNNISDDSDDSALGGGGGPLSCNYMDIAKRLMVMLDQFSDYITNLNSNVSRKLTPNIEYVMCIYMFGIFVDD